MYIIFIKTQSVVEQYAVHKNVDQIEIFGETYVISQVSKDGFVLQGKQIILNKWVERHPYKFQSPYFIFQLTPPTNVLNLLCGKQVIFNQVNNTPDAMQCEEHLVVRKANNSYQIYKIGHSSLIVNKQIIAGNKITLRQREWALWNSLLLRSTVRGLEIYMSTKTITHYPLKLDCASKPRNIKPIRLFQIIERANFERKVVFEHPLKVPSLTMDVPHFDREAVWKMLIPPLTGLIFSILLQANKQPLVYTIVSTMVTVVGSGCTIIFQRKKYKKQVNTYNKLKKESQNNLRKELVVVSKKGIASYKELQLAFPSAGNLFGESSFPYQRVFARGGNDCYFLHCRIGTTHLKTISILKHDKNAEAKNVIQNTIIPIQDMLNVPVTVNVAKNIAIVGRESDCLNVLNSLLIQILVFQSTVYYELFYICDSDANPAEIIQAAQQFYFVKGRHIFHLDTQHNASGKWLSNLKQKIQAVSREKRILLFVQTKRDECIHSIFQEVREVGERVSVITCINSEQNIPKNITTIIKVKNLEKGELFYHPDYTKKIPVFFDNLTVCTNQMQNTWFHRLANCLYVGGEQPANIPEKLDFMELYGSQCDELAVHASWDVNFSRNGLTALLGIGEKEQLVSLNLHESGDGPHALIGGMTGSGKSSLLQTYILGLSINYSPYEVGFVFIDYKGGGLSTQFDNLPHTMGIITNLDSKTVARSFKMLHAEIMKRQLVLKKYRLTHIHQYQALEGNTLILPSILLIVDEFAELKEQHNEFLQQLISLARIGRSLDIHLVLATQRPAGIISDQIWSNCRAKIALKVENPQDAKDIVKEERPSLFRQPGRCILKVGNGERTEIFQTAWCEAEVNRSSEDLILVLYSELALRKKNLKVTPNNPTILQDVLTTINNVSKQKKLIPVEKVLLPQLPSVVKFDFTSCKIALQDMPEMQKIEPIYLDSLLFQSVLISGGTLSGAVSWLEYLLDLLGTVRPLCLVVLCEEESDITLPTNCAHFIAVALSDAESISDKLNHVLRENPHALFCVLEIEACHILHHPHYESWKKIITYFQRLFHNHIHLVYASQYGKLSNKFTQLFEHRWIFNEPGLEDHFDFNAATKQLMRFNYGAALRYERRIYFSVQTVQLYEEGHMNDNEQHETNKLVKKQKVNEETKKEDFVYPISEGELPVHMRLNENKDA